MMKKNMFLALAVILLVTLVAACASTSDGTTRRSADLITAEEIAELTTVSTLYDVVSQLRPRWLTVRGGRSLTGGIQTSIVVYQEQTLLGGPEILRQFGPESVRAIEYMDGAKAAATLPGLGSRHIDGAIVLRTRGD